MAEANGSPLDPNNPPVPGAKSIPIVPVNGISEVNVLKDMATADITLFGPTGSFIIRVPTKSMRKVLQAFGVAMQRMAEVGCDVGYPKKPTILHKKPGKIILPG